MTTITKEQAQKIIDATDEVITALAGTNDDVHPDNSSKMCALWDDLNDRYAPPEVVRELARIALASLEAEPVGYYRKGSDGFYFASPTEQRPGTIPLYAAPPAPVVPDEVRNKLKAEGLADLLRDARDYAPLTSEQWETLTNNWHQTFVGLSGENDACRAAMLQGNQPVSNHDELREQVRREHAEWSDKTFGNVGPVGPLKHLSKEALEAAADPSDSLEWADMQFLLWDAQRRMGLSDDFITRAMIEKLAINKTRQWPEPKDGEPRLHIKESDRSPLTP
ncbi:DUF550 domain-containing protein [Citrobacter amalonaticus]